ncbi:hypothetical protein OH76DRAFT_459074 [Lentinus brumalis]|uniref:Uncharacterized protein n=1 Tax=Lentinus brumalis TaxID=2498619 RepID=A0A371DDG1_9APHY|nr:hypothetical protein OH76DRAFT_459074 [Polyporus brumalis]
MKFAEDTSARMHYETDGVTMEDPLGPTVFEGPHFCDVCDMVLAGWLTPWTETDRLASECTKVLTRDSEIQEAERANLEVVVAAVQVAVFYLSQSQLKDDSRRTQNSFARQLETRYIARRERQQE